MAQEYEQLLAEFRKDNNIKPSKTSKTKNTLRTLLGQGIAFGFGDEIEAKARQLAGDGRSYDEIVSEIRGDIDRFRETNPTLAYGSEILGSLPSAIAGGAGLARLGIKGAGKIAAIEGATYGAGTGEGLGDTVTKAATTAAISPALTKAGQAVLPKITDKAKELGQKGVRLTLGQQVGGSEGNIGGALLSNVEKMSTSIPAVGHTVALRQVDSMEDFNRAVMNEALEPLNIKIPEKTSLFSKDSVLFKKNRNSLADNLTPQQALDFADEQIGKAYKKALEKIKIKDYDAIEEKILETIVDSPLDELTQTKLLNEMNRRFLNKYRNKYQATDTTILGKDIKNMESELNRLATSFKKKGGSEGELGLEYAKIKNAVMDEVQRQSGNTGLKAVNKAYANIVPIKYAMETAVSKGGLYTPSQLLRAIKKADTSKYSVQTSKGKRPLQSTAQLGKDVIGDAFPDSGTASRIISGNIVTDLGEGLPFIPPAMLTSLMYSNAFRPLTSATRYGSPMGGSYISEYLLNNSPYGQGVLSQ